MLRKYESKLRIYISWNRTSVLNVIKHNLNSWTTFTEVERGTSLFAFIHIVKMYSKGLIIVLLQLQKCADTPLLDTVSEKTVMHI